MYFHPLPLEGAYIIEQKTFQDDRGLFARIFCQHELQEIGHTKPIVQINHSITFEKGTLRGMHFQCPPRAEIKLVKCISGSVFDVMVDLRTLSPTFGKWHGEVLSSDNMKIVYIPEGFAHGFQTLAENVELLYLHTEYYDPEYESGVAFDDPDMGIDWPLPITMISAKDRNLPLLSSIQEYF
jgi:dTDP-4-dehydrorhamnose 3,5-epimerase